MHNILETALFVQIYQLVNTNYSALDMITKTILFQQLSIFFNNYLRIPTYKD